MGKISNLAVKVEKKKNNFDARMINVLITFHSAWKIYWILWESPKSC